MKIEVKATPWVGGWELEIEQDHHTQVVTLEHARQQVVDYLDTVEETVDHSAWEISVVPDLEEMALVAAAVQRAQAADAARVAAADAQRTAARALRSRGVSITDASVIMGVSRGRVSQIVKARSGTAAT